MNGTGPWIMRDDGPPQNDRGARLIWLAFIVLVCVFLMLAMHP